MKAAIFPSIGPILSSTRSTLTMKIVSALAFLPAVTAFVPSTAPKFG